MSEFRKEFAHEGAVFTLDVRPDGKYWKPLLGYHWEDPIPLTPVFGYATPALALAAAEAAARDKMDMTLWREEFEKTWTDLVCGDADFYFDQPEHDWTGQEFDKREGRTGAETARLRFEEMDAEFKATYAAGTDKRTEWEKYKAESAENDHEAQKILDAR